MLLKFDARLYSRSAVDRAVEAYSEHASFEVKESAGFIGVKLSGKEADAELADEFSNYVLGGMVR